MIQVTYHRKKHRLTIEGHAQSGELGQDLICSAASILAYTMAANVAAMKQNRQVKRVKIKLKEGDAEVSCKARAGFGNVVSLVFNSVCAGFELLSKEHPDHVAFEIY